MSILFCHCNFIVKGVWVFLALLLAQSETGVELPEQSMDRKVLPLKILDVLAFAAMIKNYSEGVKFFSNI